MNRIPHNDTCQTGESFAPVCDEVPGCNAHQRTDETQTRQDMRRAPEFGGPTHGMTVLRSREPPRTACPAPRGDVASLETLAEMGFTDRDTARAALQACGCEARYAALASLN